jgi:hypothetical protein
MMLDIDLLVAASDVEPAVSALIAAGYRKMDDFAEIGHFHQLPLLPREGEASVKIHRDLSHRVHLLRADAIIDAASQVAPGVLVPALRHRILHNVIHAQIENGDRAGGVLKLRDTLDLARLMTRCEPEFDWMALADEARERGFYAILSGAIHCAHRVFESPVPNPFMEHLGGRMHAWRCIQQRRWGRLGKMLEKLGLLARALAWERDAYALNITARWSLKAQILVNKSRIRRAKAALATLWVRRLPTNNTGDLDKSTDRVPVGSLFSLDSNSAVELRVRRTCSESDRPRVPEQASSNRT